VSPLWNVIFGLATETYDTAPDARSNPKNPYSEYHDIPPAQWKLTTVSSQSKAEAHH